MATHKKALLVQASTRHRHTTHGQKVAGTVVERQPVYMYMFSGYKSKAVMLVSSQIAHSTHHACLYRCNNGIIMPYAAMARGEEDDNEEKAAMRKIKSRSSSSPDVARRFWPPAVNDPLRKFNLRPQIHIGSGPIVALIRLLVVTNKL